MRTFVTSILLSGLSLLSGCGGVDEPVTDPSKLAPLTAEQQAEIQRYDAQVEADEQLGGLGPR